MNKEERIKENTIKKKAALIMPSFNMESFKITHPNMLRVIKSSMDDYSDIKCIERDVYIMELERIIRESESAKSLIEFEKNKKQLDEKTKELELLNDIITIFEFEMQEPQSTSRNGDATKLTEYINNQMKLYSPMWERIRDMIDEYLIMSDNITPLLSIAHEMLGVTKEEIMSNRKARRIVLARNLMWYVMLNVQKVSLSKVARIFGKDHATLLAANIKMRGFEEIMDKDWLDAKNKFISEFNKLPN